MEKTNEQIQRRIRLDLMTPAEVAIYNANLEIELLPADPRLTKAQNLLQEARNIIADFIDEQDSK